MKPDKTLDELLKLIHKNVREAYTLLQTQDASSLSTIASTLAMQNFSLSYYIAEHEFDSKSLEAEYKRQCAITYMQEREGGATEKNADAKARIKWADLQKEYLTANKAYRLSKSCHDDVENLIDIGRSRIGILRREIDSSNNQ